MVAIPALPLVAHRYGKWTALPSAYTEAVH